MNRTWPASPARQAGNAFPSPPAARPVASLLAGVAGFLLLMDVVMRDGQIMYFVRKIQFSNKE